MKKGPLTFPQLYQPTFIYLFSFFPPANKTILPRAVALLQIPLLTSPLVDILSPKLRLGQVAPTYKIPAPCLSRSEMPLLGNGEYREPVLFNDHLSEAEEILPHIPPHRKQSQHSVFAKSTYLPSPYLLQCTNSQVSGCLGKLYYQKYSQNTCQC